MPTEPKSPPDEANLAPLINEIVEVSCVRPARYQQDHKSVVLAAFPVALLYPLGHLAIWGIAENSVPPHDLFKPLSSLVK